MTVGYVEFQTKPAVRYLGVVHDGTSRGGNTSRLPAKKRQELLCQKLVRGDSSRPKSMLPLCTAHKYGRVKWGQEVQQECKRATKCSTQGRVRITDCFCFGSGMQVPIDLHSIERKDFYRLHRHGKSRSRGSVWNGKPAKLSVQKIGKALISNGSRIF